jgi:hypothetical protein
MRCGSVISDPGKAAPEILCIRRLLEAAGLEPAKIDSPLVED